MKDNISKDQFAIIHYKDYFVSHLILVSMKNGGQRQVINLKDLNAFILANILRDSIKREILLRDSIKHSIKVNFGPRRLSLQAGLQRWLFLCSIEQSAKEICMF